MIMWRLGRRDRVIWDLFLRGGILRRKWRRRCVRRTRDCSFDFRRGSRWSIQLPAKSGEAEKGNSGVWERSRPSAARYRCAVESRGPAAPVGMTRGKRRKSQKSRRDAGVTEWELALLFPAGVF